VPWRHLHPVYCTVDSTAVGKLKPARMSWSVCVISGVDLDYSPYRDPSSPPRALYLNPCCMALSRSPLIGTGPARRPPIPSVLPPPLNFCFCLTEIFAYIQRDSSTRQLNFASVKVTLGLSPRVLEDFAFPLKFTEIFQVWITLCMQIGECAQFDSPLSPYFAQFFHLCFLYEDP
jgi:hypothetical protein